MTKYLDEAGVRKLWAKAKEKASEAQSNAVATAGTYTVNGKKISSNPTLSKTDVGLGNVTNEAQIPLSQKGAASGVATLGTDGKVPSAQLPSYVDDVLEYAGKSTFPATGETGKIYVDTSTNKTYRWSGTAYVEISASLALGETSSTAYAGDKGKALATKVSELADGMDFYVGGSDSLRIARSYTNVTVNLYNADDAVNSEAVIPAATDTMAGVMSAEDKKKLAGIAAGANAYSHPTGSAASKAAGLYKISTDAQSHVASVAAVTKADITALGIPAQDTTYSAATTSANGLMSKEDKSKLTGIAAGAEVNQNAFSRVTVGSTTIDADSKTDSLTLVAGTNVTITPDATNDKITIAARDTTYGVVTTSVDGLMASEDKELLDYYGNSREKYLEVNSSSGELDYSADEVELGYVYYGPLNDLETREVILRAATMTQAGVMSAADKTKLDGIVALTDTEIDAILV